MSLFQRIKLVAKENGLTLQELQEQTGIPAKGMWRWDSNMPSVDKVVKIAQCLNVSVDYLCGLTDIKTPADVLSGQYETYIKAIRFLDALPKEQLYRILLASGAPENLLSELGLEKPPTKAN